MQLILMRRVLRRLILRRLVLGLGGLGHSGVGLGVRLEWGRPGLLLIGRARDRRLCSWSQNLKGLGRRGLVGLGGDRLLDRPIAGARRRRPLGRRGRWLSRRGRWLCRRGRWLCRRGLGARVSLGAAAFAFFAVAFALLGGSLGP